MNYAILTAFKESLIVIYKKLLMLLIKKDECFLIVLN